tara:strand:- start:2407 stop:2904 length:498 start_codon:yes stop_codon:yes gene_type:complete
LKIYKNSDLSLIVEKNYNEIITIRLINQSDLNNLMNWKNENRFFFFHNSIISKEKQKNWYKSYSKRDQDYMFIINVNNISVGCMGIRYLQKKWDVYNIILGDLNFQKQGIMGKAFQKMLDFAIKNHKTDITLKVLEHNPAIKWYEKQGFTILEKNNDHYIMLLKK